MEGGELLWQNSLRDRYPYAQHRPRLFNIHWRGPCEHDWNPNWSLERFNVELASEACAGINRASPGSPLLDRFLFLSSASEEYASCWRGGERAPGAAFWGVISGLSDLFLSFNLQDSIQNLINRARGGEPIFCCWIFFCFSCTTWSATVEQGAIFARGRGRSLAQV